MNIELTSYQKDLLVDLNDALFYLRASLLTIEHTDVRDELLGYIDRCLSCSAIFHLQEIMDNVYLLRHAADKFSMTDEVDSIVEEIRCLINNLFYTLNECEGKGDDSL